MSSKRSYYFFKYEVNHHYEDSVATVFVEKEKIKELLRSTLSDENRLIECIKNTSKIVALKVENDDLNDSREIVNSYSLFPFIEISISNIKFNYWYEDEDDEEYEASFPEDLYITFNDNNETLYWAKEKTPLILVGYEHLSTKNGLSPLNDINLKSIFEDLFENSNDWSLKARIDIKLDSIFSDLETSPLQKLEECYFGVLNLIYENGESTIDIKEYMNHFDSNTCMIE